MRRTSERVVMLLLVVGLVVGGSSRAQAVIGIPDDVPAATLLYPFFKVDPAPTPNNRQDSLVVVTNTANIGQWVHVTIWSVQSQHIYDFSVFLTEHDVFSCSLLDLLVNPDGFANPCGVLQAPTGVIPALSVGDILAGYVTVDAVVGPTSLFPGQFGYPFADHNILVGHLYIVNLPAGSSTGFNAVSIEAVVPFFANIEAAGHPASAWFEPDQVGFYLNRCIEEQGALFSACGFASYGNRERIDGYSGDEVQTLNFIGAPPASVFGDSPLSLITRYFSVSALNGRTEIWLWKDRNTSGSAAGVNIAVYDEDENAHSVTFSLPNEVNFAPVAAIVTPGAPGGWFRLRAACGQFGYCDYDPFDDTTWGATPIQAVGYSLQFADQFNGVIGGLVRWDAAFPSHRQYTDYLGVGQ